MTYTIANHRLHKGGKPVAFRQTPNVSKPRVLKPRWLVMHYTAGSYAGAVSWLCDPRAKASAHLVVGENGEVTQLAGFDQVCWHAGRSEWAGVKGLNNYSIGIEIANLGLLSGNAKISESRVLRSGGKRWHTYTPAQLAAVEGIAKALHATYGFDDVLGHEEISPGRKVDPGPAFPLSAMRKSVMVSPYNSKPIGLIGGAVLDDADKPMTKSKTVWGTLLGMLGGLGGVAGSALDILPNLPEGVQYALIGLFALVIIGGGGLVIFERLRKQQLARGIKVRAAAHRV